MLVVLIGHFYFRVKLFFLKVERSQTRLYITSDLNFKTLYHLYVCRHRATRVAGYRFPSPSPPKTRVACTTPRKASRGSALRNFLPCQRSSMMQRWCVRIGASPEVALRLADLPFPVLKKPGCSETVRMIQGFFTPSFLSVQVNTHTLIRKNGSTVLPLFPKL